MSERAAGGSRFEFLDVARGVAALLVVFQHSLETVDWGKELTTHGIQFGQWGVSLFFLISGFIIPRSIESRGDLRGFWNSRVFRLYPLYWASILLILLLPVAGPHWPGWGRLLANLTMLTPLLKQEYLNGVFWSLSFELAFYGLFSVLYLTGQIKRSQWLAVVFIAITWLSALGARFLGLHARLGVSFHFTTFFVGYWSWLVFSGQQQLRRPWPSLLVLGLTIWGCNGLAFLGREDLSFGGVRSFLPMSLAWTLAYASFFLVLRWQSVSFPKWLTRLGAIS
ncbi:MAG: acyltransferase family protein [Oligoflexia bacterium]